MRSRAIASRRRGASRSDCWIRTRDWIARWRDAPGAAYRAELRRLNHLLARAKCYPEMVITKDGFQVTERWRIDSANELIAGTAPRLRRSE